MFVWKLLAWCALMVINFAIMVVALGSSFIVNLFNMPTDVWEELGEIISDKQ